MPSTPRLIAAILAAQLALGPAAAAPPVPSGLPAPDPATTPAITAAYERGHDRGAAIPLLAWGGLLLIVGGVFYGRASGDGDPFSEFVQGVGGLTMLIGAAQLVPGAVLLAGSGVGDDPSPKIERAHASGFTQGVGDALIGYGFVALLAALFAFALSDAETAAIPAVLAGGELGAGFWLHLDGASEIDTLLREHAQERHIHRWQPARPLDTPVFPLAAFRF